MDNHEAIASLKTLCHTCDFFPKCVHEKPECFQAIEMAISALQAQDAPDINVGDMISRQAAIDALSVGKELLSRVLDDMDVVGTDREKYSWGLGLIEECIKDIEELPSAQPEIIHCRDCRWRNDQNGSTAWLPCRAIVTPSDFYCGRAERRTDELGDK